MLRFFKLYGEFIKIYLRSRLEYKQAFFIEILSNFVLISMFYVGISALFSNFDSINGWTYYEVMFLYTLNLFCASVSGLFFWGPMLSLEGLVQSGQYDSFLTKPMHPLLHLISRHFQHTYIGWIIPIPFVFAVCISHLSITWSLFKIVMFISSILGGILINSSVFLSGGALSFRIVKTAKLLFLLQRPNDSFRSFIDFPVSIYNKFIQIFLVFILPYAFINYFPSRYFLEKADDGMFHPLFNFGTPIVGIVLFLSAVFIWNKASRHYTSTGS
ncbi:MAG: ABC-2 family transporter protein [Spirochaetales bacterium]|nr:ABC-2 family transporter protein [Spirochaetales bacterium]